MKCIYCRALVSGVLGKTCPYLFEWIPDAAICYKCEAEIEAERIEAERKHHD